MRILAFALLLLTLSGCVSTRVVLEPKSFDPNLRPAYVDYFDYYAIGIIGQSQVNLHTVCQDQKPLAVEQVRTIEDGLITLYTFGIYSPLTVRVWCGD